MKEFTHIVNALAPDADVFSGTVYTDIISMRNAREIEFVVQKGVGTTGTSTITVEASDDVSGSNVTAIPFKYQSCTTGDTFGDITDATTAGFTTSAGSNQMYRIYVDGSELGDTGYEFVRLKAVEVANDPVDAGILAILKGLRDGRENPPTAIV